MPDYLLWTENDDESDAEIFDGNMPDDAIRAYASEVRTFEGTVVIYAREAMEAGKLPLGGTAYKAKPKGKCWSASVKVEQQLVYTVGELREE